MTHHADIPFLGDAPDMSKPFSKLENTYFLPETIHEFDSQTASGSIKWNRFERKPRLSFNKYTFPLETSKSWEFPEYVESPDLPFSITFVDERTIRIRISAKENTLQTRDSLMLTQPIKEKGGWQVTKQDTNKIVYESSAGTIMIHYYPWKLEFRDHSGQLLTQTHHLSEGMALQNSNPIPFGYTRSIEDMSRTLAASFSLSPYEKIYGTGESFMKLDKRGQKINLFTRDALSGQTEDMYKPIPFFLSNMGYGMFYHHSCPITCDIGHSNDGMNTTYIGEDELDMFFFFGKPKEVLAAYTVLTGKSEVPPLWSFGLWMSRITYKSEEEVREVAGRLREYQIPCDVIHLDTGWFEKDWRCNYIFSPSRFDNAEKMISDLNQDGYHISLWQIPYFTPSNDLYDEIIREGLAITKPNGGLPTEDAILDFSNPKTIHWYQDHIKNLLDMGVSAIKADFGEAAPIGGQYASGKNGWIEHNLYPLRYNQAVADITKVVTGDSILWGRSAWAGSQRYPVHWGGDVENTDNGMLASLRAGLSLGMTGFSFWSHDIGGFVRKSPQELYRRWMPFGMLTSHSHCHGAPPKEPWLFDRDFLDDFRMAVELKYKLMPYIFTQAVLSAENGLPLLRPLFLDFPEDPGSWNIEDQYLFGSDLLVAPLFKAYETGRQVYAPNGNWIDYQTNECIEGGKWHYIESGDMPIIILVKEHAAIPHIPVAQSTSHLDWNQVYFVTFGDSDNSDKWVVALPVNNSYQLLKGFIQNKLVSVENSDIVDVNVTKWKVVEAINDH
ncbi:alpha-xylosidase [Gracilibacillus phocaeensis]|uniref:glycoside hydrolase family 31 protein n=1 Tax=Gracilibacillus phocaeensis TaxID=2042304 RepID=UPI001030D448|nr:alpha-xylosidase [Gracilibacillus phocaeensis]